MEWLRVSRPLLIALEVDSIRCCCCCCLRMDSEADLIVSLRDVSAAVVAAVDVVGLPVLLLVLVGDSLLLLRLDSVCSRHSCCTFFASV